MSEPILNDVPTPEEALKNKANCFCFELDEETVIGLQRIKKISGMPMDEIIAETLRPFVKTFLPIADLYEQGKLTPDCIPEAVKCIESLLIKAEVANARFNKEAKQLEKQQKMKRGGGDERKSKSST
jgi:hypothetical protein